MIINKVSLSLVLLFFVSGCAQRRNFSTIRIYSIDGSNDPQVDSIWIDTVYAENKLFLNKNSLSLTIQRIDSVINNNPADSITFRNITLHVKDTILFENETLIRYVAEYPIEYGTLSFYGVHLLGFGTVYWRWLDGRKALLIRESNNIGDDRKKDFRLVREFLIKQLSSIMKDSDYLIDTAPGVADSIKLDLDSTLFNPK